MGTQNARAFSRVNWCVQFLASIAMRGFLLLLRPLGLLCSLGLWFAIPCSANFIFDDFDLDNPPDIPDVSMTDYRFVNDFFGDRNYTIDNFDGPGLSLLPRFDDNAAELYYDEPVGFDFLGVNRFVFKVSDVSSNYTANLSITTIGNGTQFLATGVVGTDVEGFPILAFDLTDPIEVSDLLRLSFNFSAEDGVGLWDFGSTELSFARSVQAIPEPTSMVLVGAALACGASFHRMQKRRKSKGQAG